MKAHTKHTLTSLHPHLYFCSRMKPYFVAINTLFKFYRKNYTHDTIIIMKNIFYMLENTIFMKNIFHMLENAADPESVKSVKDILLTCSSTLGQSTIHCIYSVNLIYKSLKPKKAIIVLMRTLITVSIGV